jgi:hypothetical protein
MSTINMPGFTAEASLYPTSRHYQMAQAPAQAGGAVRPAGFVDHDCYTSCNSFCGPDCKAFPRKSGGDLGRCLRVCRQDCLRDCTFP